MLEDLLCFVAMVTSMFPSTGSQENAKGLGGGSEGKKISGKPHQKVYEEPTS